MSNTFIQQTALGYLETHQVMTIATVGANGVWAAAVFYVNDGFDLFFLSAAHTRHAQNIETSPQASATIQEDYRDWQDIKGIQLEGCVEKLSGESRRYAETMYVEKYPFLQRVPLKIQTALKKISWYKLTPTRLYFIDNSKGFGHRDELFLD
ncbi:MAG: pyridoxamine 5'-phosphate oxidase [Chloroflexi bacterium]|nr:pyridoxamine 5'-phosphate oxidase [Chloroflexota bacterium]